MKLRKLISGIIIFLLLGLLSSIQAETASTQDTYAPSVIDNQFDVQLANRILDKLTIQLSIQNLNISSLEHAITALSSLKEQANICAANSQKELDKIDLLWKDTPTAAENGTELTSLQKYLAHKKNDFTNLRSECRLFVIRSNEAISAFGDTVGKLNKKKLLRSEPRFWARLSANTRISQQLQQHFNWQSFFKNSGLESFNTTATIISVVLLILSLLLGFKLKQLLRKLIPNIIITSFSSKIKFAIASTSKYYVISFLFAVVLALITATFGIISKQPTYLMLLSFCLILFILVLALIQLFFYPFHEESSLSGLTPHIAKLLVIRTKSLVSLCFLATTIYLLFFHQTIPENITDLVRTIFITLITINLISILWLVNRVPKILYAHKGLRYLISSFLTLLLLAIIVAEWMGYQELVTFTLRGIAFTLIFGFLALTLYKILVAGIKMLSQTRYHWQERLREYLGVKPKQKPPELYSLHIIIFILIWGFLILLLLKTWGISASQFQHILWGITNGFKVAGIDIIPSRILFGLFFFTVALLIIRWLSSVIEHISGENVNRGSQQALAAIVGYVGFAIVLLLALLIAGVNFAGLAIIAGALSVGIGFGLQNIVNNFVSGLILLVERPIKPGDRIIVGNTEGFVKKISIRATQIQTLQYSDLIVPNSEIISGQVTNLMFKDFYCRINIEVGIAYGSNTDLVKETLLEIAQSHPEVISEDGPHQPNVLFSEFGDNSLKFNLFCIIRNVNLKYSIASELRFAIDKAFREKNICIAFPQRDIHIRDWTKGEIKP